LDVWLESGADVDDGVGVPVWCRAVVREVRDGMRFVGEEELNE